MKIQDMNNKAPGWQPTKTELCKWLDTQKLGCVASLDITGHPQVATVAFSQTKDLEFIIGTSESSRKALNIMHDNRVAFVVTDPVQRYTLQMEGTAKKLTQRAFDDYAETHFKKLPASAPFRNVKGQCYFLIKPLHVRFSDCNPHPWALTEFAFGDQFVRSVN